MLPATESNFVRVTAECPCPICGKPDWCMIAKGGKTVLCARIKSTRKCGTKGAGWLHEVKKGVRPVGEPPEKVYLTSTQIRKYLNSLKEPANDLVSQHASILGISVASLRYVGVRYDVEKALLVFPQRDGFGKLRGCRFRRRDGSKWSLKGSKDGLFFEHLPDLDNPVVVTEGMTDTATAVHVGFHNVVGRSSCYCGEDDIKVMAKKRHRVPFVIIADPNEEGLDGAKTLAYGLKNNPAIVMAGPNDLRKYNMTLRTKPKQDILRALAGEETQWRIAYKNIPASYHDMAGLVARMWTLRSLD